MTDRNIEIKFKNETVKMESALIAGIEKGDSSTTMYSGPLSLDDLHQALFLANTGVLKILTRELDIKLENCDEFLLSAVTEALVHEWNVQLGKVPNMEFSQVVKYPTD